MVLVVSRLCACVKAHRTLHQENSMILCVNFKKQHFKEPSTPYTGFIFHLLIPVQAHGHSKPLVTWQGWKKANKRKSA